MEEDHYETYLLNFVLALQKQIGSRVLDTNLF